MLADTEGDKADAKAVLQAAERLAGAGRSPAAIELLESARAKWRADPVANADALVELELRLGGLKQSVADAAAARASAQANVLAMRGDQLARRSAWSDARAVYDEALKLPDLRAGDAALIWKRRWDVDDLEADSKRWLPGALSSLAAALVAGGKWVVIGAAALLLVWIASRLRGLRKPTGDTVLTVEDLTAPAAERAMRGRVLTRSVLSEIRRITGAAERSGRLDDMDAAGAAPLIRLMPVAEPARDGAELIREDSIQLGPLAFNPRQLYLMLRQWMRRPDLRSLRATFYAEGESVVLALDADEWARPNVDGAEVGAPGEVVWRKGDGARGVVVREFAARLMYRVSKPAVPSNADSYAAWVEAQRCLDDGGAEPQATLAAGRELLERSLAADPLYVFARIRIGGVLREQGRWSAAAGHLRLAVTHIEAPPLGSGLEGLAGERPELLQIAKYNLAAALMRADGDWRSHKEAVRILEELVLSDGGAEEDGSGLSPSWRDRLWLLTRSALASALVFELEESAEADDSGDGRRQNYRDEIAARISGLSEEVGSYTLKDPDQRMAKLAGEAVALNAAGQAAYLTGRRRTAESLLRQALSRQPRFVGPYVTLARILLKRNLENPGDAAECEALLAEARVLQPKDPEVHFLLGRLYRSSRLGDDQKALAEFEQAPGHAWAQWNRAEILLERPDSQREAIAAIARAIELHAKIDFRYVRYCEAVLDQPPADNTKWMLESAWRYATAIGQSADPREQQRGQALRAEVGWRLGYERRAPNLARAKSRLASAAADAPLADQSPTSAASVVAGAIREATKSLARLEFAERADWNAAAGEFESAVAKVRQARADYMAGRA